MGSEAPEEPDSEPTAAAIDDHNDVGLDDGLKCIDESCVDYRDDLLKGVLSQAVVWFEPTHQLRVVGEAELAWPESKVAIILQKEFNDVIDR